MILFFLALDDFDGETKLGFLMPWLLGRNVFVVMFR